MRVSIKNALMGAAVVFLLAACGGGGGGSSTSPTATFALQAGYIALTQAAYTANYTVSGDCAGTAVYSKAASQAATFEGITGYSATDTLTINLTNCSPTSSSTTTVAYYDANYAPVGDVTDGGDYGVFQGAPTSVPASVKVGDTAALATENIYADSTKTTPTGTLRYSYVIEPDGSSATTAILNLTTKEYDTSNQLVSTQQNRFRMVQSGTLTPLSIDFQSPSALHLRLTAN